MAFTSRFIPVLRQARFASRTPIRVSTQTVHCRHPNGRVMQQGSSPPREVYRFHILPELIIPEAEGIEDIERTMLMKEKEERFWIKNPDCTDDEKKSFFEKVREEAQRYVSTLSMDSDDDPEWAEDLMVSLVMSHVMDLGPVPYLKSKSASKGVGEEGTVGWLQARFDKVRPTIESELENMTAPEPRRRRKLPPLPSFYDETLPFHQKYLVSQWLYHKKEILQKAKAEREKLSS
eukprot:Rmarinus@m.3780